MQQWERILRAHLVQISEVYANSPFSIFLSYHRDIGQPHRILNFSNTSIRKQLFYFLIYHFDSFWSKLLLFYFTGLTLASTFSVCIITDLLIRIISEWDRAKHHIFSRKTQLVLLLMRDLGKIPHTLAFQAGQPLISLRQLDLLSTFLLP